jgi:hypothetical protein
MKFGNFTIFEKTPEKNPAPVLGLKQAEAIFKKANGHIKGDVSGAVPFAIISTAEILGAEIRIEEDCTDAQEALEASVVETRGELEAVTADVGIKIERLENQIIQSRAYLEQQTKVLGEQTDELRLRQGEVRQVQEFFMVNGN